ncbi:hypothetical protein [Devosia submarina]|uniref:hypothetical protein n=1 Tax=Devosia submarina TaxID=1173082 RepID=UPI000D3CB696|nr:hypothetical protein [Devosia submarina]
MTSIDYNARAELFLGSDRPTALAQGPRNFRTAAQALRFAFEQAAPVSLRGASLRIGTRNFTGEDMARLYHSPDYPLSYPLAAAPRRKRRMPFYGASFARAA